MKESGFPNSVYLDEKGRTGGKGREGKVKRESRAVWKVYIALTLAEAGKKKKKSSAPKDRRGKVPVTKAKAQKCSSLGVGLLTGTQ